METESLRTPSEFPGPEKRDGEMSKDIISQSVDCFPRQAKKETSDIKPEKIKDILE